MEQIAYHSLRVTIRRALSLSTHKTRLVIQRDEAVTLTTIT